MTVLGKKVKESVEYWVEALNLQHWEFEIEIVDGFDVEDAEASCSCHPYYDKATLRFHKKIPHEDIDYCVVHELFHAHMRDYDEATDDVLQYIGHNMNRGFTMRVHHTKENFVDKMTRIALKLRESDKVQP